jgi:predicted nucleotidyltransferase
MIKSVAAEAPSRVTIVWRSGKHTTVELAEYLDSPGYEKLREPAFFISAAVEEWGHGIEWGHGELGIDADTLYRLGKEQAGLAYVDAILKHHPTVQAIYLFGSYATEDERDDSDVDIALLLRPEESKMVGSLCQSPLHLELERLLNRNVDLINLRNVSTVLQKEVIFAERRIYDGDMYAADEFEMLTMSLYQKLNEERAGILQDAIRGGRLHQV